MVGGDVHSAVARVLDDFDQFSHPAPIHFCVHLEVQDVGGQAGLFPDLDGFFSGPEPVGSFFGADVRNINAAVLRRDSGELDQLAGGREHVGRVHQTRR